MAYIEDVLKKAALPAELPAQLARMEKDVDTVIDAAIKELQDLKINHRKHIEQYKLRQSGNVLRDKLVRKQSLDLADTTGGSFF